MTELLRLPNIIEVTDEEGYTKRELRNAKQESCQELFKEQYANIYRIFRSGFTYYDGSRSSILELLAEFDNVSGELTKFNGWLEAVSKDDDGDRTSEYASISLTPVKTTSGLIYHFRGTLEFPKKEIIPLSIVPVYGIPSGRIIELKPVKIGESRIFEEAKLEYRSLELRLTE